MASMEQLFQDLGRMSYSEKVSKARYAYQNMISVINAHKFGNFFVAAETAASWYFTIFCGVDRRIKYDEHKFYVDVTSKNVSYDWFYNECVENDHPEMTADLRRFMSKISYQEVGYFQTLAALIFSLKSDPTYDEKMYLMNYFN